MTQVHDYENYTTVHLNLIATQKSNTIRLSLMGAEVQKLINKNRGEFLKKANRFQWKT